MEKEQDWRDAYADSEGITHVVQGRVTCPEVYGGEAAEGDPEWQFSDAKPGERGCSADYSDLAEGLRDFAGRRLVFYPTPTPPERPTTVHDAGVECFARLSPHVADTAGRFLWAIAKHGMGEAGVTRAALREAGEALLALGNDSDAILCAYRFDESGAIKGD